MRQGGNTPTFAPKIDAVLGRIDIAISRPNDESGASGTGLLAGVLFQAVAPGNSQVNATAVTLECQGPGDARDGGTGDADGEMSGQVRAMRMFRTIVRRLHLHRAAWSRRR